MKRESGSQVWCWKHAMRGIVAGLIFIAAVGLPQLAFAQTGTFLVNRITEGDQGAQEVSVSPSGDIVAVWTDFRSGNLFGRRFDASAMPLGDQFQLNVGSPSNVPMVLVDKFGRAFCVWATVDGAGHGATVARRFSAKGKPLDRREFAIRNQAGGEVAVRAMAGTPAGVTTLLYQYGGVLAFRRFHFDGRPFGDEVFVTQVPGFGADIAVQSDGSSLVTWSEGLGWVYFSRYSPKGVLLSRTAAGPGFAPAAAAAGNGTYVLAFQGAYDYPQSPGIFAQRVDSGGNLAGPRIGVGSDFDGSSRREPFVFDAHVAADSQGRFVVVYTRNRGEFTNAVYAARYAADGFEIYGGGQLTDNEYCCQNGRIAMDKIGNAVVVWQDGSNETDALDGADGSETGIFGRLIPAP